MINFFLGGGGGGKEKENQILAMLGHFLDRKKTPLYRSKFGKIMQLKKSTAPGGPLPPSPTHDISKSGFLQRQKCTWNS